MTHPRFPFFGHRTQAEVVRTEALIAKADTRSVKFTHRETSEFGNLLIKARKFNPPPANDRGAA